MNGWNTAYINIPQAAGLATERLSGHVKQRIRWARGMIQIMRTDNPLFARGLNAAQRLCYFNAMTHFLYALPRLIFLTAPLIYLHLRPRQHPGLLGRHPRLRASAPRPLEHHELPHPGPAPALLLERDLRDCAGALHLSAHPAGARQSASSARFNVTAKGGVVNRSFFDSRIAQPFLFMLAMNIIGMLCAIPRLLPVSRCQHSRSR